MGVDSHMVDGNCSMTQQMLGPLLMLDAAVYKWHVLDKGCALRRISVLPTQ